MKNSFRITKTEPDKMMVFGWANVAIKKDGTQVEDLQGDIIEPEELENAAYHHVLNFRKTGEKHNPKLREKGRLVESCVFTLEKQKAIGIPENTIPVGWWVGYKIDDKSAWEKIKKGEYEMFSVEGTGERTPVDDVEKMDDGEIIELNGSKRIAKTYEEVKAGLAKVDPYYDR